MKPTITFAMMYLAGVCDGLTAGTLLPWWLSGAPAWVFLVACFLMWSRDEQIVGRGGHTLATLTNRLTDAVAASVLRAVWRRCLAMGGFFGLLAGAAAADASEIIGALICPDHEVYAAIMAIGVALSWLLGTIASEEDDATFRPGVVGLGLYLITVALAVFPALWSVL